jgi:hypothetical protein
LNNVTARVCKREDASRPGKAGHVNKIQGVVAKKLNGTRGKRCDVDGQAGGRMSGSELMQCIPPSDRFPDETEISSLDIPSSRKFYNAA